MNRTRLWEKVGGNGKLKYTFEGGLFT